jgi:hypothetical protein
MGKPLGRPKLDAVASDLNGAGWKGEMSGFGLNGDGLKGSRIDQVYWSPYIVNKSHSIYHSSARRQSPERFFHHSIIAAAQVNPAPNTMSKMRSPRLNPTGLHGLVEGNGDGGRGGVAVLVEIDEESARASRAEAVTDGFNDALVGLVRDDALDLGDVEFALAKAFLRGGVHRIDGVLESLAAFHAEEMEREWTESAVAGWRLPPPGM